jgi:hypothetical protein
MDFLLPEWYGTVGLEIFFIWAAAWLVIILNRQGGRTVYRGV